MYGLQDIKSLSPEKRELLLDVGQFTLDIIGMFEPTPFADLTNGVISLMRGDYSGAAMSTIGVVPYVGDLAKAGKIPRYVATVDKAIQLARVDVKFGAMMRPILRKLLGALDRIPLDRIAPPLKTSLERMRRSIAQFLPGGARVASRLDQLTDEMLRRVFGSTQNIGTLQRSNVRRVVEFFDNYNVANKNPAEWAELFKGIDFHAAEPFSTVTFKGGDRVAMYVETKRPADRQIGQWMTLVQGSVSHRNLGLSGNGRVRKVYCVKKEIAGVEALKTKAAAAADHWTLSGPKPHNTVTRKNGKLDFVPALQVAGGGDQYFLPKAWDFLEEVVISEVDTAAAPLSSLSPS